jgi:hypothetical protein
VLNGLVHELEEVTGEALAECVVINEDLLDDIDEICVEEGGDFLREQRRHVLRESHETVESKPHVVLDNLHGLVDYLRVRLKLHHLLVVVEVIENVRVDDLVPLDAVLEHDGEFRVDILEQLSIAHLPLLEDCTEVTRRLE